MAKTIDKKSGVFSQDRIDRSDWETVRLGDVCNIRKGQSLQSDDFVNGYIPVIAGGMSPAGFHNQANRTGKTITISASGASAGYVSFWEMPIFASDCSTISECPDYDIGFIYQVLKSRQSDIYKLQTGGAQPHIHPRDVAPMEIPFPNISVQRKIAVALESVDERINSLSLLIAKQQAVKKSTLSLLMRLEKKWGTMRLCEFGHFLSGSGFPISFQGEKSGDYPFCKVSDFNIPENSNAIVAANNYISRAVAQQLGCKIVPAGAIVFAKIGAAISLERKRLVKTSCCIDNNMMAFVSEKVSPDYCCQLLQRVRFQDLIEATALPSLSAKVVGNIAIPVPSLPEQRRIANSFAAIDEAIQQTRSERKKVESMKAGLMRYFFG